MARISSVLEFFTDALKYKNGNIANFFLALPLQSPWSMYLVHNV